MMLHKLVTYLETLFNRDEECMESISLEQRFLFVDNNTLVEASNTMISDVEWIGVG